MGAYLDDLRAEVIREVIAAIRATGSDDYYDHTESTAQLVEEEFAADLCDPAITARAEKAKQEIEARWKREQEAQAAADNRSPEERQVDEFCENVARSLARQMFTGGEYDATGINDIVSGKKPFQWSAGETPTASSPSSPATPPADPPSPASTRQD